MDTGHRVVDETDLSRRKIGRLARWLKKIGISDAIDTKLEKEGSANNETSTMVRRAFF